MSVLLERPECAKNNVSVLMLFFIRPDTLEKVFESVAKARPSKLFLFQDGARCSEDEPKIAACRKIVENITWDCEIYRNYCEENLGCDNSQYIALKWAFEKTDSLILLEDDCVPSQSFYPFCEKMLDKYRDDYRVHMICGMNHMGDYSNSINEDYLFAKTPTIWGWATWKRAFDLWDTEFSYLDDVKMCDRIYENIKPKKWASFQIERAEKTRDKLQKTGRISSFELLNAMAMHLQSSYAIIPSKNMISNVGISEGSVHNVANIKYVPKGMRRIFNMETYELDTDNLNHPKYIVENAQYRKQLFDVMGRNNRLKQLRWKVESKLRRIFLK